MSKVRQGGTKKWCSKCQSVQVCAAINLSLLSEELGRNWCSRDHLDINWYRRALECKKCGNQWISAELSESFVEELIEIRGAFKKLEEDVGILVSEADKVSVTAKKISASFPALNALIKFKSS